MKLRNIVALICALAASAAMADKLYLTWSIEGAFTAQ